MFVDFDVYGALFTGAERGACVEAKQRDCTLKEIQSASGDFAAVKLVDLLGCQPNGLDSVELSICLS